MILKIGSRSSDLAKNQAESVINRLEENTDARCELATTDSLADENPDQELDEIGQVGVFTSSLDQGVLNGEFDAAVHSLKDCPTDQPEGLTIAAMPPRITPLDALVGTESKSIRKLPDNFTVGTSSHRRRSNAKYINTDIRVEPCRGNVPTRLEKLDDEESKYDALILAVAGINRLRLDPQAHLIRTDEILPAPGQGALAVTCRADNDRVQELLQKIDHEPTRAICTAERGLLSRLGVGCQAPVGGLARLKNNEIELRATITHSDGHERFEDTVSGKSDNAHDVGRRLADDLLKSGAGELIET